MDQAASVISTAGSALYITFYPKLAAELVPLPGSAKPLTDAPADTTDGAAKETKADAGMDKVTEGVAKLTTETPVVTTSTSDAADQAGVRASFVAEVPASSTDVGADKTAEDASKLTTETPVVTTSTSDAADQAGVRASFVAEVPASSSATPASATDNSVPAEPAKPPKPAVFVIANSLVVSDKVVHAKTRYNLRVVETLAAARVLARLMQVPVDRDPVHFAPNLSKERITLRELLGRWVGLGFEGEDTSEGLIVRETKGGREEVGPEGLMEGLREIREAVEFLRPKGAKDGEELGVPYEEMVKLSQLSEEEFKVVYPGIADGELARLSRLADDQILMFNIGKVEASHFQLYKRTKHVYDEALRVLEFRDLCLQAAEGTWGMLSSRGHNTDDRSCR
jgi:galactokinase